MEEKQVQINNSRKRKLIGLLIFALFFLLLGRNLTFIPRFNIPTSNGEQAELKTDVQKIIRGKGGFYSVYFQDLKNENNFGIDQNQTESAASVNKIPLVAALYYMAGRGKINLDDKITISKKEVQDYGTGSIRYQELPVSYSLRNLAKLALEQSDNTAAHVIGVKIGLDQVQNLADSWGMKQTNILNDKSTVYDMGVLFGKIYNGEITNPPLTQELLSFLTETDTEDCLPKDLPKGTIVYHKTGDGLGVVNDVGLIKNGDKIYYLGVMTSDIGDNEQQAKDTIAKISKKVFDQEQE